VPRRLGTHDYVYRVIDPEHRDENGPQPIAFEDPGKNYSSVSLFVATVATPCDALAAIAPYSRAKTVCKKATTPTPAEMLERGYRVARIPAAFILQAIAATKSNQRPLAIAQKNHHDYQENGHLDLHNGKFYAQTLASEKSGIIELSPEETLEISRNDRGPR
jgi:hypothetical protein